MSPLQAALLLVSGVACVTSSLPKTGYIDYYPGTLNVILSSPHGGLEEPDEIPLDRDYGCYKNGECVWSHDCGEKDTKKCKATTVTDAYTLDLTLKLRNELYSRFGEYPYVVASRLKRTKLDPNRERNQASFNVPLAAQAWDEYHGYIQQARANITSTSGPGILFDIHGHGRPEQWAMLGYLINGPELEDDTFTVDQTSIKALVQRAGTENFESILRGVTSLGVYMENEGFDAVPSIAHPHPDGASFYRGGYITREYGSIESGTIDAIQIESPSTFRRERFDMYVAALGEAIETFILKHYSALTEQPLSEKTDPTSGAAGMAPVFASLLVSVCATLIVSL